MHEYVRILVGGLATLTHVCVFLFLFNSNPTLLWGANVRGALLIALGICSVSSSGTKLFTTSRVAHIRE